MNRNLGKRLANGKRQERETTINIEGNSLNALRGRSNIYIFLVLTRTRQVIYALITFVSFFLILLTN